MPETIPTHTLLEWQSLDSHPHVRSKRWYTIGGICVIAFAAYGLWDGSWSTALLALAMGAMYFYTRNTPPGTMRVEISSLGITIGGELTQWNMLKDFWILVGRNQTTLHIAPSKKFRAEVVLFLDGIDPGIVRDTLLPLLPERSGMEERMLDSFARILKL